MLAIYFRCLGSEFITNALTRQSSDDNDDICDWRLVWDRIGIGGGRGILIFGGKATPHGVGAIIIFVDKEGGGINSIWYYLCDEYESNMDIFALLWLW